MMEWKEYKISEIINEISMGPFGSNIKRDCYVDAGVPYLNGSNLCSVKLNEDVFNFVTEEKAKSLGRCVAKRGDIIVTHRGTIGQISYIPFDSKYELYLTGNSQFRLTVNSDMVRPDFLVYFFHTRIGQYRLLSNASQVGVPALARPTSSFKELQVPVPPKEIQNRITSILSSLDDKIAVNKKICENLEAQAQALFKHWFVDFAPFKNGKFVESELGMIPEGWRMCTLGEICKCELGGTPSRANKSYWGGNIAWINSGEVNKFRICEASEFITEEGLNHSATKLLPSKTTVLAITGATLGQISLLEIDSCANQSVVGVKENETIPYTFIYPAIKYNISKLVNMQTGGAQQHINKENIQSLQIIEPPKNIMEEYKSITLPLYDDISKLCFENLRLATLRDTLLPKLMSGEIKI